MSTPERTTPDPDLVGAIVADWLDKREHDAVAIGGLTRAYVKPHDVEIFREGVVYALTMFPPAPRVAALFNPWTAYP